MTETHAKNSKPKRVPLWLPYLQSIKESRGGIWEFAFNGGVEKTSLDQVQSIMIYGESDTDLNVEQIDKLGRAGIPLIIHRRNMAQPIYISSGERPDKDDVLSKQIVKRVQFRTKTHIARQLLKMKMTNMSWIAPLSQLPMWASVKQLRNIEAVHAKKYWRAVYTNLNHPEWARRDKNPVSLAFDAQSKFISGIILRWITYHHLSPFHGFLHETTDYPSLVYDLIEPYRGIFEKELLLRWKEEDTKEDAYLSSGIVFTKELLHKQCYVPLTRQIVTYQELLHGIVLSLRYYLMGKQRKFLIPNAGKPNGGRPAKVDFLLYGRHAGKTNFWEKAREVSAESSL
jgi:CRISPR/Cas system-associated endonuclease Cas1